ncbi:MAG: pilus assembly protein [Acidiferrobacterales bacterium]
MAQTAFHEAEYTFRPVSPRPSIHAARTSRSADRAATTPSYTTAKPANTRLGLVLGLGLLLQMPQLSHAGQLNLANSPLFLGTAVEPNVFMLSDDSGSMDWDVMTIGNQGRITLVGGDQTTTYSYVQPAADNNYAWNTTNGRILPSEEAVQATADMPADAYGVWRGRFSGYNVMYYNPEITYTPWPGIDGSGSPFADINPTAASLDPFNTSSPTVDLTANWSWTAGNVPRTTSGRVDIAINNYYPARYYIWTDTDANSVVDPNDGHTRIEIKSANAPFAHTSGDRTDCTNPLACTYSEEIQNFANWFSYYRRREATAKHAMGNVIAGANGVRLGYATLHNNSGANNIEIASMNPDPATGNKRALIDGLYQTQSNNGTPLRQNLRDVGRYYECVSGNLFAVSGSNCPILNAASGGTCQQNFAVLMTDGFYNGSSPLLGNHDGDNNTAFDGPPYDDAISNTLADVAMHYYERDLAPSLADQVPVTAGVDNATHQHMVTYTVAFGVTGELDPFDTKTPGDVSDTDPNDPAFSWTDPFSGSSAQQNARKIDDLWHAAYNGRGLFLNAQNADELSTTLSDAIANITDRTGSAAAVALNSASLSTDTRIFQARFNSGEWSGQLRAIPIDTDGNLGSPLWDAGEQLKAQAAFGGWSTNRTIITWDGVTGIPFSWGNLNAAQQAALNKNGGGVTDGFGPQRLDYIRGDASNENVAPYNFRVRKNDFKLGDIVQSAPVFIGAPPFLYPDTIESVPYSVFRVNQDGRTPMVYVGANDGMLHGFDADTGEEKIAYVASKLYNNLSLLTDPGYPHRYFVDGAPTAGDAFYNSVWHTVLIGTLRGGGQGIFALDVTDPSNFNEINASGIVMWEFTDAADPDLGYTFGKATIAKMQNGKWAVIVGNGYNNTENDGGATTSPTGDAVLYIIDIETGTLIRRISTERGIAESLDGTTPNGLATPAAVDVNGDYVADLIYAGDLQGNLWKFDVQDSIPNNWGVAAAAGPTPQPLFTARDAANIPQPITVRPQVSHHPDGGDGFMVFFGTGKYMETGDNATAGPQQVHTFYGIWDEKGTNGGNHTMVSNNDLQTQTIGTGTFGGQTVRTVSDNPINAWGTGIGEHMGWRVDLPSTAEKAVTDPVLRTGRVIFTTLVPNDSPCAVGGTSWLMELNFHNGGPPDFPVFDLNDDGLFNDADKANGAFVVGIDPGLGIMPEPVLIDDPAQGRELKIATGTSGDVQPVANNPGPLDPATGRRSWRQLQ